MLIAKESFHVCRARLSYGPRKMKDWKFLMVLQSKTRCEFFKALSSLRQNFDIELRILCSVLGIKKKCKAEAHPCGVIYCHGRGIFHFKEGSYTLSRSCYLQGRFIKSVQVYLSH